MVKQGDAKATILHRTANFLAAVVGQVNLKDGETIDDWLAKKDKELGGELATFFPEVGTIARYIFPDRIGKVEMSDVDTILTAMASKMAGNIKTGSQAEREAEVNRKLLKSMEALYNLTNPREVRVAKKVYHEISCPNAKESMQKKLITEISKDVVHADCCDPIPQKKQKKKKDEEGKELKPAEEKPEVVVPNVEVPPTKFSDDPTIRTHQENQWKRYEAQQDLLLEQQKAQFEANQERVRREQDREDKKQERIGKIAETAMEKTEKLVTGAAEVGIGLANDTRQVLKSGAEKLDELPGKILTGAMTADQMLTGVPEKVSQGAEEIGGLVTTIGGMAQTKAGEMKVKASAIQKKRESRGLLEKIWVALFGEPKPEPQQQQSENQQNNNNESSDEDRYDDDDDESEEREEY